MPEPIARTYGPAWLTIVGGAIVPGLGHLLLGRKRRRAALLFAPILVLALVVGVVALVSAGSGRSRRRAARPRTRSRSRHRRRHRRVVPAGRPRATVLLAARVRPTTRWAASAGASSRLGLAVVVIAPHVIVGAVIADTRETILEVFDPTEFGLGPEGPDPSFDGEVIPPLEPDPTDLDEPTPTTGTGTDRDAPTATPTPAPTATPGPAWAADGRLDVLLIGADAGPDRWSLRTDTMILLSVDVATGRSAMFGFPRNMVGAPLPKESAGAVPGGRYPGLLNSIYVYANAQPGQFPGGQNRGFRAIGGTIQKLAGVQVDGIAVVNLNGFVRLVDALGGVTIDIPTPLHDNHYPLENGTGVVVDRLQGGQAAPQRSPRADVRPVAPPGLGLRPDAPPAGGPGRPPGQAQAVQPHPARLEAAQDRP